MGTCNAPPAKVCNSVQTVSAVTYPSLHTRTTSCVTAFSAPTHRTRKPSPGARGVPGGTDLGAARRRSVLCGPLRPRWGGARRCSRGENRCHRSFGWVSSTPEVAAEAPGGVHLGKVG